MSLNYKYIQNYKLIILMYDTICINNSAGSLYKLAILIVSLTLASC